MQLGYLSPLSSPPSSAPSSEKKRHSEGDSSSVSPFSSPEKKARSTVPAALGRNNVRRQLFTGKGEKGESSSPTSSPEQNSFFDEKMFAKFSLQVAPPDSVDVDDSVLDSELERVEQEREALSAKIETSPKKGSALLTRAIKAITTEDFDKLKKVLIDANKNKTGCFAFLESAKASLQTSQQRPLVERIIACSRLLCSALDEAPDDKLKELQALKIALYIEEHLVAAEPVTYVHKSKQLARAFVLVPESRQVLVLSKKVALFQADGGFKKITSSALLQYPAINAANQEIGCRPVDLVRITNKADDEVDDEQVDEEVEALKKEVRLAKLFNNDVLLSCEHTSKTERPKFDWFEERYDSSLQAYLYKKKQVCPELEPKEQFIVLLKTLSTLKVMHDTGFVHDDLNAKNIVLKRLACGTLQAKLIDFGKTYNLTEQYPRSDDPGYGSSENTSPEYFFAHLMKDLTKVKALTVLETLADGSRKVQLTNKTLSQQIFLVGGKLPNALAQGKADDMYALGCMLYSMIFRQEMPWALCVQRGMDGMRVTEREEALERQLGCYGDLLKMQLADPFKQKLLGICIRLLDPNPATRMTVDNALIALSL